MWISLPCQACCDVEMMYGVVFRDGQAYTVIGLLVAIIRQQHTTAFIPGRGYEVTYKGMWFVDLDHAGSKVIG